MKKRTLCLLLAGVMALSLLSGCGGQPTGGQPNTPDNSPDDPAGWDDNVPNNEAPMVPPDDWEDQAQPEDSLPFPRDPRWDELQPGETAVQYYDIFIKSGMTVGEAVQTVESSKIYGERNISWGIESDYQDLDRELTAETAGPTFNYTDVEKQGPATANKLMNVFCDGVRVMSVHFFTVIPGEAGATYRVRDLPIFLVSVGYVKEHENLDETLTFMGSVGDIRNMDQQKLTDLMETAFQSRGPNIGLGASAAKMSYNPMPYFPFSWTGYSIWSCRENGEPEKGFPTYSSFLIERSTGLMGSSWVLDALVPNIDCWWVADDAG